jgi:hypothetical protein
MRCFALMPMFFAPLRAFAPIIVPALGETTWVKQAIDQVKEEVEKVEKAKK